MQTHATFNVDTDVYLQGLEADFYKSYCGWNVWRTITV